MSKNKKLKELLSKDIEPLLNNNLDYNQIKDKITINENISYNNIYHTQHKNYKVIKNRYKFAGALLTFLIITCISLLMIKDNNKDTHYNISPYNNELQGVVFGGQIKNDNINLNTISNLIDQQKDNKNPLYFYEVDAKNVDNYYTCAYLPTEYYQESFDKATKKIENNNYTSNKNVIDGKLIYGYSNLNYEKDIKWYQFEKDINQVPLTIKDYSLGLILESRDVYFYNNKTLNKQLEFTKKLFIRNFYNIETKVFENKNNNNYFIINLSNRNLILSYNLIENNKIEDLYFLINYQILNNNLIIKTLNNNDSNILGRHQEQLGSLLLSSEKKEDGTYGYYDYQKFCETFLLIK